MVDKSTTRLLSDNLVLSKNYCRVVQHISLKSPRRYTSTDRLSFQSEKWVHNRLETVEPVHCLRFPWCVLWTIGEDKNLGRKIQVQTLLCVKVKSLAIGCRSGARGITGMLWANQQHRYDGRSALDNHDDEPAQPTQKLRSHQQVDDGARFLPVLQMTIAGHYSSKLFYSFCNLVFDNRTGFPTALYR